ncbi:lipoate--protein ligase family protein [Acidithiobacillus sp.]|uniref:lipoyl protein ligase domain-containing protein n=1 Tax=Acidithiobacillus sp. TaxID=1872118 RepID=UPI0032AFC432
MERLRWLDLGHLSASALHQAYQALATLRRAEDPSLLVLASAEPHLSLGASQVAGLELDRDACASSLPIIQRPIGGGLVWVEPAHLNYFLLVTPTAQRRRPEQLLAAIAPIIQAVHAHFGISVELAAEQEFRCRGRRIGSTGAASIGNSLVLAGSYLLCTDWAGFADRVAASSNGFRATLRQALSASLTSWAEERQIAVPAHTRIKQVWQEQLQTQSWQVMEGALSGAERAAMLQAELEPVDWEGGGRRRVANGIKLRAGAFLTERHWPDGWLRVWTEDGRYRAVESNVLPGEICRALVGMSADSPQHRALFARVLGDAAEHWQRRLHELTVWTDQL